MIETLRVAGTTFGLRRRGRMDEINKLKTQSGGD